MGGAAGKFWEQLKSRELPTAVFDKLKGSIERRKKQDEAAQRENCYHLPHKKKLSPEAIGDIRSYFFKAIVELFSGYYDCIGKDEDGDTIFLIYKFIEMRPDNYRGFYKSFFQHNLERLEHFGFMEFLNLQDEGANDSELAARKEIFDSCAEIMQHTKRHFRDDENTDEVWGGTAAADDSEGTQSIYKLWPSKKTDKEISDLYLGH